MATISVPLSPELAERLDTLVEEGVGANRADVMRRALQKLAEREAVRAILEADQGPTLHGDLRKLAKKLS
ncbi:MAG: ribbon-helix-helix protein, CopG family [Candidatus Pacebacteria bacterium]|nr:ribbon-helix-helix protein, CopG family [Candidatus Paceibacterota bacterium]